MNGQESTLICFIGNVKDIYNHACVTTSSNLTPPCNKIIVQYQLVSLRCQTWYPNLMEIPYVVNTLRFTHLVKCSHYQS